MSLHIFGAIITSPGIAANNRGENEGNITTLQKILWNNQVHTTVSAEAIRWAIRYYWQTNGIEVNRVWDDNKEDFVWQDQNWLPWTDPEGSGKGKETFIDDDVLGFMLAEAAGTEGNDTLDTMKAEQKKMEQLFKDLPKEEKKTASGKELEKKIKELKDRIKVMTKGTCDKRRGVLEIARAISTTSYAGDITFNAKSGEKGRTSLYGAEVHATRYQYGFAFTPERLRVLERTISVIDAIANLRNVAGNHSRFLFDFSPESIILRITDDPAPRLLYCFEESENGAISAPELVRRVKSGDIGANELYIGGRIYEDEDIKSLNVAVLEQGIKPVVEKFKETLSERLSIKGGK